MRKSLLALGLGAACLVAATQSTSTQSAVAPAPATAPAVFTPTVANVPMPELTAEEQKALAQRMSPERLAEIRARLQADAQRAVRDGAEGFREPTAAEAAALALPAVEGQAVEVALPNGGVALKADASSLSLVTASVDAKGRVVVSDKEGRRDQ